jgi:hypothetical protein
MITRRTFNGATASAIASVPVTSAAGKLNSASAHIPIHTSIDA